MSEDFDDTLRWYWAVAPLRTPDLMEVAGDKFVIAAGTRALFARVRSDIDPEELASWEAFGEAGREVTFADCMRVFIRMREVFGVHLNRLSIEMAQIPAFASFIHDAPWNLRHWVSSPLSEAPLVRPRWDHVVEERLGRAVEQTLGLTDEDRRQP